jgi:hypothetical protein
MLSMRFLPKFACRKASEQEAVAPVAPDTAEEYVTSSDFDGPGEPHLLRTVGWLSAALGAVALGLIVGRELRQRYKFNRRTPYDLYAHSGDELPDVDFGVGI